MVYATTTHRLTNERTYRLPSHIYTLETCPLWIQQFSDMHQENSNAAVTEDWKHLSDKITCGELLQPRNINCNKYLARILQCSWPRWWKGVDATEASGRWALAQADQGKTKIPVHVVNWNRTDEGSCSVAVQTLSCLAGGTRTHAQYSR